MTMIEKWHKFLDIAGHAGALLTDLSKAFDCTDHELLIAKLHAYGFDTDALKFIYSDLKGRKQCKLIVTAFIMSQFSYCHLIWMFHSRAMEHRINRIHERTLRLIYPNRHQLTVKKLLEKNKIYHTPKKFTNPCK